MALTQNGVSREDAYKLVQKNAMETWHDGGMLIDRLKADPDVTAALSADQLEALFDLDQHFARVDVIFDRVFA